MNANLAETQYNLSKWHEIIKECSSSNLGIIQWLKENNISKDQYYYWKKKLKDMCLESLQPAFVELPAPSQRKKSDMVISNTTVNETDKVSAATIRYKDISIDLNETASTEFIGRLFEAIKYAK